MLKPGICYYQFSSVAELCQFFASVISISHTILSNAFSVRSFSHNRVPISHYHYIIRSLGSIQYFFQRLVHILYFFLFVIRCWHVDLYSHNIDWSFILTSIILLPYLSISTMDLAIFSSTRREEKMF